jgi:PHD/YefM family antitoxin component YafN of YafNO toxin-antitoxin module
MILTKLSYRENIGNDSFWEVNSLNFGMLNLIIGLNATGKTRLVNVISNLAKMLSKKIPVSKMGNWNLEFQKNQKEKYKYKLEIIEGRVQFEEIKQGNRVLLRRENEEGIIYSYLREKKIKIHPPKAELTLHVRRDVKEFPFLEDLFEWSNNFVGYQFTGTISNEVLIPSNETKKELLESLGATPYLLKSALNDDEIVNSIINDFSSIGYPINKIDIKPTLIPGIPSPALIVDDADYTVITRRDSEDAVVMSLDTFNSFLETFHLLKSPANAEHLAKSIAQYRNGETLKKELINE